MSGTKFKKLIKLRNTYPATTAACHTMVMMASDLRKSRKYKNWMDINGISRAKAAFDKALKEMFRFVSRETGETNPAKVVTFLRIFVVQYSLACPNWTEAYEEISEQVSTLGKTEMRELMSQ